MFQSATAYTPDSPASWIGLGTACLRLKDLAGAEENFARAVNLDATNPTTWCLVALGGLLQAPPRIGEALSAFKRGLDNGANDFDLLNELLEHWRHLEIEEGVKLATERVSLLK